MKNSYEIFADVSKWLFFILTGLALSNAVGGIFNYKSFSLEMIVAILLLIGFILTAIRFSFGFVSAIDEEVGRRDKNLVRLLIDLHFYLLNAVFFVVIAKNIYESNHYWFYVSFCLMLFIDVVWIVYDHFIKEINLSGARLKDKARLQFIASDILMIAVLMSFLFFWINDRVILEAVQSIVFVGLSVFAVIWDYSANKKYYEKRK